MLNRSFIPKFPRFPLLLLLAGMLAILAGCGAGDTGTTTGTTGVVVNDAIALGTSATSIKTDNTDSATLTATVTASNALLPGVTVTFSTTSGNLSAISAVSDASGKATVTLTSGASDFSTRTAIVTVTAGGKTATIPVLINGSTLTLTPSAGSVQVGVGTVTLTATAKNAAGVGSNGQTVRFSIGAASTGAATLSATTLATGVTGTTGSVTLTPTAAGTVVVTADWLDSSGAVSVTATQVINVTAAAGVSFSITTPATSPLSLATSAVQPLAVTVPTTIGGITVASVRISSTAGTWTGTGPVAGPAASITQTPAANAIAATYTASNNSGVVTVQVDALGAGNTLLSTLTRTFVISAPTSAAFSLSLQASPSTIHPSSGSNSSTATLTASVRDATTNSVGNAAVLFELLGTTGSGESISPTVAYTNGSGQAAALFTAGSLSTLGPIYARARVVGEVCTGTLALLFTDETNPLCKSTPLLVASTAVSITIGFGTTVADTAINTQYLLHGSLLVVDANGSPVSTSVNLSVFPILYRNGSITTGAAGCVAPVTAYVANEDINRNGILDPGEDSNSNGIISPGQAAGGAIPVSVTTDSTGVATFDLQYPKSSAFFIVDAVTATATVSGTEGSAYTIVPLPMSIPDSTTANTCSLARTATY